MKKVFRMGIIGCGNIAHWHIRGIMDSPDLEVGAICDILPEKIAQKQALCGIAGAHCYSDYRAMLDSGKIDAVSICVPNYLHHEVAMEAIQRGLPYAVEKPVCDNETQVAELVRETEKKGLPNMVCFSYRFKSAARYARDLIRSGQLGKIYQINGEYFQAWGLPGADGRLTPLNWRFTKEQSITGALGDLGSHIIDLARFMTGFEYTKVTADLDTFIHKRPMPGGGPDGDVTVDDYVNIIGQMAGQGPVQGTGPVAVNISISRYAYGRGNYQRVQVYGDKGALCYNLDDSESLEINIGNAPMRMSHMFVTVPVPAKYNTTQMQSFADILGKCGDGLAADIHDGLISQRVVDKSFIAAESGARQNI
ncbi:MAG: Gfo/Idh/MocA family oxidoreductase [Oscillospiraceae bacterium]|nr:Gfo/Idh/MocA family oxidoreductase [Oscillospiraceae bacterium]